ncbi:hypothetical protein ES703_85457 [subsurface metagenome]
MATCRANVVFLSLFLLISSSVARLKWSATVRKSNFMSCLRVVLVNNLLIVSGVILVPLNLAWAVRYTKAPSSWRTFLHTFSATMCSTPSSWWVIAFSVLACKISRRVSKLGGCISTTRPPSRRDLSLLLSGCISSGAQSAVMTI